jgi:hypothetical protein
MNVKIVNLFDTGNRIHIHDSQINADPDTETLAKHCTHELENAFQMVVIIQQKMSEKDLKKMNTKRKGQSHENTHKQTCPKLLT